jgi:hypothetical protein
MFMPGGKLLTPEQSARFAVAHGVDRDKLIERIANNLRAQQRKHDRRMSRLNGRR